MNKNEQPTYCYCKKCGEPVTWFNYQNIWKDSKIVAREHTNCQAPDIIAYKLAHKYQSLGI